MFSFQKNSYIMRFPFYFLHIFFFKIMLSNIEGASTFPVELPEPPPVTIDGKTYDYYAMTQKMRAMERDIRALKREKETLEALGMDTTEIRAKIRRKTAEYKAFCKTCNIRPKTERLRYECGTSDLRKTEAWKKYQTETEKQINIGKFKLIDVKRNEMKKAGIPKKYIDNIESTVQNFSKEYEVRLNSVEVGKYDDKEHIEDNQFFDKVMSGNFFAGNNVEDFTIHELCHVLTFQDCVTFKKVIELNEILKNEYVPGISGYNDICRDGSETIAEAFVLLHNEKDIPERAMQLVEKYIERWKK